MRGKKELFMLITGLVLFVSDLVTDIVVAVHYKHKEEYHWFGLTLFLIIVPYIIINGMATYQATLEKTCADASCYSMFLCSSIFVSFGREFINWKNKYRDNHPCRENYTECNCTDCKQYREIIITSNKSTYDFAWIHYVESLMESTPQWCLKVYIMLRQWKFPWTTVLSAVFSLLSLAWNITTLEKARITKEGYHFKLLPTIVYFINQLIVLMSRLFAIVIFAYEFKVVVFYLLPFLWLISCVLLTVVACIQRCCGNMLFCDFSLFDRCSKLLESFPLTFFVSEAVLESFGFGSFAVHCFMFCVKSLENFLMVGMAVESPDDETHMSILTPIAWASFTIGFFVGIILLIVYNKKLKPKHKTEEPLVTVDNENIRE
ncbi:XK-related 6-like, partial [Paramuricea clavata]